MKQFDALRKRNAFVDNYRQFRMFRDGFEEFDHAKCDGIAGYLCSFHSVDLISCGFLFVYREVVTSLIEEYQAAEKADYLSWGSGGAPAAGIASSYVLRGRILLCISMEFRSLTGFFVRLFVFSPRSASSVVATFDADARVPLRARAAAGSEFDEKE